MAGFRPDLDLTEIIEDYEAWFDGVGRVEQKVGYVPPPMNFERPITADTTRVDYGPITFSTCTDLAISPEIIWDANHYYRALGADPRATRKDLRLAFHEANGDASEMLMYFLQQLLDPDIRHAYDMTPLGQVFMDKYVQKAIKDKAMQEAIRRARESNEAPDAEAVMDEMGFKLVRDEEPDEAGHASDVSGSRHTAVDDEWRWSYFLHKVRCYETERLSQWQQMLVTALSEAGAKIQIAVGYSAQGDNLPKAWTQTEEASIMVAYLGATTTPTLELARRIARELTARELARQISR